MRDWRGRHQELILQVLTLVAAIVAASAYWVTGTRSKKGTVKGILYTVIDSSVMVDNQVLKEGDTIYSTKVVRIYPKKVEFEKNGKRWAQRVSEYPDSAWDETEGTSDTIHPK